MHQSFLAYRESRWLWIALGLCAVAIVAYAVHQPMSPPSGGTWLGYTLGGVSAALVLWLTALGVRKRSYRRASGNLQGWVSAHVYLGVALVVIATLHTGFQFGWNLHTAAYALMCVVVASGIGGVILYLRVPAAMVANRANVTRDQMLAELADLDQRAERFARSLPAAFQEAVRSNRDRTTIGGTLSAVLGARDRSRVLLPGPSGAAQLVGNPGQERLLDWLGAELARSTDGVATQAIRELMGFVAARRALLARIIKDAQAQAWLGIWLYVHVPVTLALIGALIAHVFSVFYYW